MTGYAHPKRQQSHSPRKKLPKSPSKRSGTGQRRLKFLSVLSGHGPRKPETGFVKGKVGSALTLEVGQAAARLTGLDMLSAMQHAIGGLDKVVQLVKVTGMVNSDQSFTKHPQVINGFSELMIDVFGEKSGKRARSPVGMSGLPFDIAVETEAIFQVQGKKCQQKQRVENG